MKIAVLYGGISGERDVSLSTGKGVIEALEKNGHDVIGIDFDPKKLEEITSLNVDLVFIGLHGKYGEDGAIQGLLEMLNIPYVGSGILASALAMDKAKAKELFDLYKIPIAKSDVYTKSRGIESIVEEIHQKWQPPFVIKPNREGSTLGLTIVESLDQVEAGVRHAFDSDSSILVEDYVKGRELTVPVLGKQGEEEAYPVIEIIPKNDLYDYESKYAPGGSEHIVPAPLSDQVTKQIQEYAIRAHQSLGCKTYSRVDFLLQDDDQPIILEVNTLPGMTPTSLFPDAAKSIGVSYEEMIEKFVHLSI